jgi:hypothetical protein
MKQVSTIVATVLMSAALTGSAWAADMTCKDIHWKPEIQKKYPGIEKSCVGVVTRDGKNYVRVSGKVRSKEGGMLKVRLDNTDADVTWKPAPGDTVSIEGKATPAKDVVVGQALRFYMLEDKVVNLSDAGG